VTISQKALNDWIIKALDTAQKEAVAYQVSYFVPQLEELKKENDLMHASYDDVKKNWQDAMDLAAKMKASSDHFESLYDAAEANVTRLQDILQSSIDTIKKTEAERDLYKYGAIGGGVLAVIFAILYLFK
jgi:uncharacterized protein YukE